MQVMPMNENPYDIQFPVIYFSGICLGVENTFEELTTCTRLALRHGFFNKMLLVEATGRAFWIGGAQKLHGVGLFWGYNIFLNQRIRVKLLFEGEPFRVTVDEVKKRVFDSFDKLDCWSSGGNLEELRAGVRNAQTVAEIVQVLRE
jgi:hypothetical protein